jgi:hypothetical protein
MMWIGVAHLSENDESDHVFNYPQKMPKPTIVFIFTGMLLLLTLGIRTLSVARHSFMSETVPPHLYIQLRDHGDETEIPVNGIGE